jgi:hypothetical protein
MTYPIGTIAHCNKCDKAFALTRPRQGGELVDTTTRLQDFETCPHCDRMDSHWIYKRDYQPVTDESKN